MDKYISNRAQRSSSKLIAGPRSAFVILLFVGPILCTADEPASGAKARSAPEAHPVVTFRNKPKPLSPDAMTEDWPCFLGPSHDGISRETKLLKKWPDSGPTLVWEMKTGAGYSPPSIVGDRLVFFHRVGDRDVVECLQPETGRRHWPFAYPTKYRDRYGFSNGPRGSPTIDDGRIYVHGVEGLLHCLDLATGNVIWKRDTSLEFKVPQDYFGVVASPLIEGDLLIVNVGAPGGPCVLALDKRTGKEVWRAGDQWGPSCASPVAAVAGGKRRLFVFAGGDSRPPTGGLLCMDPASGKVDSRFPFRSKSYESANASSPVVVNDRVFLSTAYGTGGVLLGVSADGSLRQAWRTDALRTHFMTPIHKDGYLYGFDGMRKNELALVCVDIKTGKRLWRVQPDWEEPVIVAGEKRKVNYTTFHGSLLYADGHFLCLGQLGHLLWLDLTPEGYKQVARTWLFSAEETWTPPVLSRGLLYVMQNAKDTLNGTPPRLLCYDLRANR